ncbi:hypothetical protein HKD37_18G051271 [Glycine soja]
MKIESFISPNKEVETPIALCWLHDHMARRRDFIRDIDNTKDTLKLAVRIIDLWFVETKDTSKQAEMIIMDENVALFNFLMLLIDIAEKIHVLIRKEELKTWKLTQKENNTYMMHNFKILIFTGVIVVIEQDLPNIPLKAYEFVNFADIFARTYRRDQLVDVISVVHELTSHHVLSSPKRVLFTMKDLRYKNYLYLFIILYVLKTGGMETMVIMLRHTRIKEAQVGVSLPIGVLTQSSSQKGCSLSQSSGSSQYLEKEKFFYKAEVKSLFEINDITMPTIDYYNYLAEYVTDCVTVGTIERIIVENHGWCYASCMKCNKSVVLENEGSILRYKLEVMVYHKKQSSNFMLWDRECIELIGKST